jgi:mono/diheme cytochrome c family protein
MRTTKIVLGVTRLALLMIASVLALGASRASAQENAATAASVQKWNYDELTNAPEKARARQNPLEGDQDAARAGGKLFERHCAECHGMKAEGGKRGPSLLRREVQQAPPGALFWVLTNGVVWHGMPVWSKLPEPQRWQIVTFLKSLNISATQGGPGGG